MHEDEVSQGAGAAGTGQAAGPARGPVTLKDVAARAGVSAMTVSSVVNGRPHVAPRTLERVRAALAALNYQPNLSARHLRNARVGLLALAIPDLVNPVFADIGNAVVAAAAAYSYTVLLDHTGGERLNESRVVHGLRPHLIDGVILSPLALEMADIAPERVAVPMVLLGERLFGAPCDHVVVDNVAAARLATEHLVGLGRRRIAAIGLQAETTDDSLRLRLQGYAEALTAAGQRLDAALIVPTAEVHRADGAQAMRRLLALDRPPDAVFCYNDLLAMGALRALDEAGYRVPDDVAVVGFDNIEEGEYATPSLTTIAPDKAEIGRLAVALLLARIDGTRSGPPERIEPACTMIVRESTVGRASLVACQS
jgi:DNA-binding LacI/PurR family transcriptional regulator